jgi:hypothetical protein
MAGSALAHPTFKKRNVRSFLSLATDKSGRTCKEKKEGTGRLRHTDHRGGAVRIHPIIKQNSAIDCLETVSFLTIHSSHLTHLEAILKKCGKLIRLNLKKHRNPLGSIVKSTQPHTDDAVRSSNEAHIQTS